MVAPLYTRYVVTKTLLSGVCLFRINSRIVATSDTTAVHTSLLWQRRWSPSILFVKVGPVHATWGGGGFLFLAQEPPPEWATASSFTKFLDHTRRTTVGTTPLDEWSARRRDLYLTTRNTHNRHTCSRLHSNPRSQQASGRRPTP